MNKADINNSSVVIIDVQEKLVKMLGENDSTAKNAQIIAKAASILNVPIIITEQYPNGLGETIKEIKENITNANFIEKTDFSACTTETFKNKIKNSYKKQIIILGIEMHICVLQTAIDLLNEGYEVFVVENACGSRINENKKAALKRLQQAGAQIVTTEMVLFAWLKGSKTPHFKEVQALIK